MKALITGASEGIGRSLALLLKEKGYAVTVVARNESRLKTLLQEMGGGNHQALPADLSTGEGIDKVAQEIRKGAYDLVINNAGISTYGNFRDIPTDDLHRMMRLNCDAVMDLSQVFLKTAKSGDALVNVSSTASYLPMPVTSAYAGSKGFVTAFTESVWYEERKRGVYVLAVCPGMTRTEFHERSGGKDGQIPNWFSQSSHQVAEIAWRQLQRRSNPVVICGPQKPLIFLSKFLPRKWVTIMAGRVLDWGMK